MEECTQSIKRKVGGGEGTLRRRFETHSNYLIIWYKVTSQHNRRRRTKTSRNRHEGKLMPIFLVGNARIAMCGLRVRLLLLSIHSTTQSRLFRPPKF